MKLIWKAQVLDCWRLIYCADSTLLEYFDKLASQDKLPTLDSLIINAGILQQCYETLNAYKHALSEADWEHTKPNEDDPGAAPGAVDEQEVDASVHSEEEEPVLEEGRGEKIKEHVEEPGFDGDCCIVNVCLFKFEIGLWIEFSYAVSDGDTGRAWQIIKTWILIFSGSTNTNYMLYLLEMFCLLTYDTPELEQLVEQTGKLFNDPIWCDIASPNVHHVMRLKDEIEKGFGLSSRGNHHTSPDYLQELLSLLTLFSEEELHLFHSGRSLGHKAINLLDKGFIRLDDGQLEEFLRDSTEWANFLRMSPSPPPTQESPASHLDDSNLESEDANPELSESERSTDSWGEDEEFTAAQLA
ncbi:hypothetical protein BDZ89DRAFT_1055325, partial [Hymenopellis radicata]